MRTREREVGRTHGTGRPGVKGGGRGEGGGRARRVCVGTADFRTFAGVSLTSVGIEVEATSRLKSGPPARAITDNYRPVFPAGRSGGCRKRARAITDNNLQTGTSFPISEKRERDAQRDGSLFPVGLSHR